MMELKTNRAHRQPNPCPLTPDVLHDLFAVLAVLMCAASFLVGHLGPTRQKLLVVFTVTAFHSLILCQYVGCTPAGCGARGTFRYFMSFVLSFTIGSLICQAATNALFPW